MRSRLSFVRAHADLTCALALGVAAALLRLPRALSTSFWQDEVASARILAEPTFSGMLHHVVRTESTPPLWYAIGWLIHRAGVSIHDVRLFSVLCNAALVASVVLLARKLMPLGYAAVAGALVGAGAEFSAQGRWIRAYELFALLVVWFAFALLRALDRPTRGRLVALALVTLAGALTHYFFFYSAAAGLCFVLVEPGARGRRRGPAVAILAGLAPFALWLPALRRQMQHHGYSWIHHFNPTRVVQTPLRLFTPLVSGRWTNDAAVVLLAVCAWGGASLWRRGAAGRLAALFLVVPYALATATWAVGVRVYATRNLIEIGPFVAVAVVAAVTSLPGRARPVLAAGLAAAIVCGFAWDQRTPDVPYRAIADALVVEGWRAGDPVAVYGAFTAFHSPLEWYLPRRAQLRLLRAGELPRRPVFVVGGGRVTRALRGRDGRRVDGLVIARVGLLGAGRRRDLLDRASIFSSSV